MNILCSLGIHKWNEIIKHKKAFPLGKYKSVRYFGCKKCALIKEDYNKRDLLLELSKEIK